MSSLAVITKLVPDTGGGQNARLQIDSVNPDFSVRTVLDADVRGIIGAALPADAFSYRGDYGGGGSNRLCPIASLDSVQDILTVYILTTDNLLHYIVRVNLSSLAVSCQPMPAPSGARDFSYFAAGSDGSLYLMFSDTDTDGNFLSVHRSIGNGPFLQIMRTSSIHGTYSVVLPLMDAYQGIGILVIEDNCVVMRYDNMADPYDQAYGKIDLGTGNVTIIPAPLDGLGGELDWQGRFYNGVGLYNTGDGSQVLDMFGVNIVAPFPVGTGFGSFNARAVPTGPGRGHLFSTCRPMQPPI